MPNLFTLQCPTCGAGLQVAGEKNEFACQHCGNKYLLDRKIEEMNGAERENIQPTSTYTTQTRQWIKVASYEIFVHAIVEQTIKDEHVLYIEVEYRNGSPMPLACRHDQWIIFDHNGYTYEPVKDFAFPHLYEQDGKRYLGMSRTITQGMRLRGWLAFVLPPSTTVEYLQFSAGTPTRTVEFQLKPE